jgi:hypothetical protein
MRRTGPAVYFTSKIALPLYPRAAPEELFAALVNLQAPSLVESRIGYEGGGRRSCGGESRPSDTLFQAECKG